MLAGETGASAGRERAGNVTRGRADRRERSLLQILFRHANAWNRDADRADGVSFTVENGRGENTQTPGDQGILEHITAISRLFENGKQLCPTGWKDSEVCLPRLRRQNAVHGIPGQE